MWNAKQLPPQTEKTIIITGATSGICCEAALVLAKADTTVVLASRNEAKGSVL